MPLYKPVNIANLQEIQDAVLAVLPKDRLAKQDLFYLPKKLFLNLPKLVSLLEQLDLLEYVDEIATVVVPPHTNSPIHIDSGNNVYSFNIPIKNCKNTFLAYYSSDKEPEKIYLHSGDTGLYYYHFKSESTMLVDKIEMCRPYIVNVQEPHGIINPTDNTRILIAIRLTTGFEI